jgi:hypothetical protein
MFKQRKENDCDPFLQAADKGRIREEETAAAEDG